MMTLRYATPADWQSIVALHRHAGYGFALPRPESILSPIIAEKEGRIVAAAGFRLVGEVIAVVDVGAEPQDRLEAIRDLHRPLAETVLEAGVDAVYAFADPQFRNFDRRLMRMGWSKKLWPCLFLEREEIEQAYAHRANCHS